MVKPDRPGSYRAGVEEPVDNATDAPGKGRQEALLKEYGESL